MKHSLLFLPLLLLMLNAAAQDSPKGLNVNDKAPLFTSTDQNGKELSLEKLLKKGSVVLVFYRGQWCPYCNKQLMKLQDSLQLITSKGATLVAVSPEKQENISKTISKTKATYPIVYDNGLSIMNSYHVAYKVDAETVEKYKKYGIDFTKVNGEKNGAVLPVPAVYVINKDGVIVYRHFDPDYTKRASVAEIIEHL